MKILGFDRKSLEYFKDYLKERQQTVTVETFQSDTLMSGPISVCQGSTLSGLLYLIYTLDYPLIHSSKIQTMKEYNLSEKPRTTTFVNDSSVKIHLGPNKDDHNLTITNVLHKITDYMNSNSLKLNQDMSNILIISNNPEIRDNITIKVQGAPKPITPVRSLLYLGVMVQDDMKWNKFLTEGPQNLTQKLTQKLNAIKLMRKYTNTKTTKILLNGVFTSTLLYGAALWIGAPQYLKTKIQSLKLEACRTALGPKTKRWSTSRLLKEMNWLPISKILERENAVATHKIINNQTPQYMNYKMNEKYLPENGPYQITTGRNGPSKIGTRPKDIGKTRTTKYHFRTQSYNVYGKIPEKITQLKKKPTLSKNG